MNVNLTPQIFVTDGNGKIVYSHTGYSQGSEMEVLENAQETEEIIKQIHSPRKTFR